MDPDFLSPHRQEVHSILKVAMQLRASAVNISSYDILGSADEDVAEQPWTYRLNRRNKGTWRFEEASVELAIDCIIPSDSLYFTSYHTNLRSLI